MSFQLVKAVINSQAVANTSKLVLIVVADFVNDRGDGAWPAIETIAKKVGISERHTKRVIRQLEADGLIHVIPRAGRRGTNLYFINLPTSQKTIKEGDIRDTSRGHSRHVEVTYETYRGDTHVTQIDKNILEPIIAAPTARQGGSAAANEEEDTIRTPAPRCKHNPRKLALSCVSCNQAVIDGAYETETRTE